MKKILDLINQKKAAIKALEAEVKELEFSIENELVQQCKFKINDIIKGEEKNYLNNMLVKNKTIIIDSFKFSYQEDHVQILAFGHTATKTNVATFPYTKHYKSLPRRIIINNKAKLLGHWSD